ncbi:unnamed protein product [Heterobilharzia americana]|nr:unnamed protein product [Heterobilharzia americana]
MIGKEMVGKLAVMLISVYLIMLYTSQTTSKVHAEPIQRWFPMAPGSFKRNPFSQVDSREDLTGPYLEDEQDFNKRAVRLMRLG